MIIGVPKEIKKQEHRVALPPSAAYQLTKRGHQVLVEQSAGVGSGFTDPEYALAGATLVETAAEIFQRAELIVKVKEPQPVEVASLRPGQLLFTYLHLAADKELTLALMQSKATAIAYETVEVNRRLPLLEPMSEIAGRMSVLVGGYFLAKHYGGSGTLLGGVPGVLAGKVVVLGGGSAGINAARMATGLGADVTILEVDIERMRYLDITLHNAHTLYSDESRVLQMLPGTDLLIGAVLVPGAKAPKLIRRDMLRLMRPGSVLVDIAIDQGGCAETSRPTTHEHPVFVEEGVTHYCVANMPGAYARTATQALTNATYRFIETLADHGLGEACRLQPSLLGGINVMGGHVTHRAVADAHGLPFRGPENDAMKHLGSGFLLVIEGIDGAGKTTLANLVQQRLQQHGRAVIRSREPTDGVWGRKLRESAVTGRLSLAEEFETFLLDRREHVESVILPALRNGKIVVLDRYYFSTMAYQGARGLDPAELMRRNEEFAPEPDLLVLLDLDPGVGLGRVRTRGDTANLFEKAEALTKAREIFNGIQKPYLLKMDATQKSEALCEEIVQRVLAGRF